MRSRPRAGFRARTMVSGYVVLALVGGVLVGCTGREQQGAGSSPPPIAPSQAQLQSSYEEVVRNVLPSVVQITSSVGLGSGIVYDGQGHVVTNSHVVGTDSTFQVGLATGGPALSATLVNAYPPDDLAVIKIQNPPSALKPVRFGDSSKLNIGAIVLAMGNPLGYTGSVTQGIVSGTGRVITEPQGPGSPGATIAGAIQTSAAINPGNSGGALVDLSGQVIGIPTLAALDPELGGSAAPGIGFAIPSNTVTAIAGQIVQSGHVTNSRRAELGVTIGTVVNQDGQAVGAGVAQVVQNGPAQHAGIAPGDIITEINGTPTPDAAAVGDVLASLQPGNTAHVTILRPDGSTATVDVVLGQLPG